MAFNIFETSRTKGSSVELFRFRYGVFETDAFCYTNGEKPITHLGLVYEPLPIKRGKIVASTENASKNSLDINLPGSAAVCDLFQITAPPGAVTLTVFQGHLRDPDGEYLAIWTGRITACSWEQDGNAAKLICEPARSQLRRLALRRHFQYMCPHALYGDQCRASEVAATLPSTIYAVTGRFITVDADLVNPTWYKGGMIKWASARGVMSARTIVDVATVSGRTRFTLSGVGAELVPGLAISCVRGCSHTIDGCLQHNNVPNYGGQPFIPTTNPLGVNGAFS